MRDLFREIYSTLRQNKLRTALTGFAVSWGIFLLIALLGAGNGLMNSFSGNVADFVSQSIIVEGWRTSKPYAGYKEGRMIQLDRTDVDFTASGRWAGTVRNVSYHSTETSVTLSRNGQYVAGSLLGVMPDYMEQEKVKLSSGRFINPSDLAEKRKVMVIADSQARELAPDSPESLVGSWVRTGGISWLVVGIYHADERSFARYCNVPLTTYKTIYDQSDKVEAISFNVEGVEGLEAHKAFESEYGGALRLRHDVAPDDRMGIWIRNGYTDNLEMDKASSILQIALWILGILTLISGIVGVSNIMLITVKERTHEFGIRKAIGARPGKILQLIIAESVTITAVFGYFGMLLGMIACEVMDATIGRNTVDIGFDQIRMLVNPSVGVDTAIEATLLLIVAGTIAGAIPAWKASKVKPIEALRAE